MQTSTHAVSIGATEVRKEFVAGHEAEAEREWDCLALLAEHAPGLAPTPLRREDAAIPATAAGSATRPGTTEDQAAHFMALVGHD